MWDVRPGEYVQVGLQGLPSLKSDFRIHISNEGEPLNPDVFQHKARQLLEKLPGQLTPLERSIGIGDAAHYYGSTPISAGGIDGPFSDSAGRLQGVDAEVLVLGSSLMAEGGHAHPTLLTLTFSRYLLQRFRERLL